MDQVEEPSKPTPAAFPLLSIGPVTHENAKGKPIDLFAIPSTVMVELTYLKQISDAIFSNADLKKFIELAQVLSPDFCIVYCGSVPLLA